MNKHFNIFIALLSILILFSCSKNETLHEPNEIQVFSETSDVTETKILTTTLITVSSEITTETIPQVLDLSKYENMNYENNYNYRNFIYFTDYGRYYHVEIGGRDSANYVLCFESIDGSTEILTETEDSVVEYSDNNSLYLRKYKDHNYNQQEKYKLVGNKLIPIENYPFDNIKDFVSLNLPDNIGNYWVYDDKIFYDYNDADGISYYDLKTGEIQNFDTGKVGIISNGYIYYRCFNKFFRFDLSTFEYELMCEFEDTLDVAIYDAYEESILYSTEYLLYTFNNNEHNLIFSTLDFFGNEGYKIGGIQCQDNRIFLEIYSGAFYQCIMEIDIDGNVIEIIHED